MNVPETKSLPWTQGMYGNFFSDVVSCHNKTLLAKSRPYHSVSAEKEAYCLGLYLSLVPVNSSFSGGFLRKASYHKKNETYKDYSNTPKKNMEYFKN
ncbi:hypothetical protein Leryth_025837 [Lithospermum erythrorhizon]|nr:hypothetical protein Leryth_025837 [Lithospermum erythrorhizon]